MINTTRLLNRRIVIPALIMLAILCGCTDIVNKYELATIKTTDVKKHVVVDRGNYTITSKYDTIRSYPGGGGIFVFKISPGTDFSGKVMLELKADKQLNASLQKDVLNEADTVCDIIIAPNEAISLEKYSIKLTASHGGVEKSKEFHVGIMDWTGNINDAIIKLNEFKTWISENYPDYAGLFDNARLIWSTYPQTLIVEHYTFLTDDYEVRICYHVMVPPSDWSMLSIRKRNSTEALFAAKRETGGIFHTMPVSDYPEMYGY